MVEIKEVTYLKYNIQELTNQIKRMPVANPRMIKQKIQELDKMKLALHEASKHPALKGF